MNYDPFLGRQSGGPFARALLASTFDAHELSEDMRKRVVHIMKRFIARASRATKTRGMRFEMCGMCPHMRLALWYVESQIMRDVTAQ